jgi:hypothetical protein
MSDQSDPAGGPGGEEFARRTRQLLEQSAAALSARTRSRLTRARHAALDQLRTPRVAPQYWRRWLPAGAAAAAVLALLLVVGRAPVPISQQAGTGNGDDLELLADSDALALAQDQSTQGQDVDYDFYEWAVTAADEPGSDAVGS